jgi:uncharacterized protein (TIGR01777 family)
MHSIIAGENEGAFLCRQSLVLLEFAGMSGGTRILVSGVSGPIGAALLPALRARGSRIVRLVRGVVTGDDQVGWDPAKGVAAEKVEGFDAVIHLAGETIVGRWTAAKKARILGSRVQGTRGLAEALAKTSQRPRVLLCASAIGYYGSRGDEVLREGSPPGNDFLSMVCEQWEGATRAAVDRGIRTVNTRFGVILSREGGALPKMLPAFRMGVGGKIGDGQQWWSWIHIADVVGAVLHALDTESLDGAVNVVAPVVVKNAEFTKALASVLHRPAVFPMPAFAARLAFGEMAEALLLASQRVEPAKLLASRYAFRYAQLDMALTEMLRTR